MNEQISSGSENGQLVTFDLGGEIFGVDIFKVQEVLHLRKITSIPNAPDFVEGVIDIRNRIIPVVDLKKRLNIANVNKKRRRIVVLDLDQPFGIIVDDISKVLTLDFSQFEALPDTVISQYEGNCISRLAKNDENLIIVISPERILTRKEKQALKELENEQAQLPT